jgi:Secretion system C-terminal sorting domain/Carbohydrate esterase, sialic acid-specific acetylesterase
MIALKKAVLISILICCSNLIFSQIKLTSPQNRAVYQRNGVGFSAVTVAGSYEKQVDKIEARLIPVQAGQGGDTDFQDWKTIKTLPLNGNFSTIMSVRQGWYKLEIRGSLNGIIIGDVVSVDRVGVGEVFIIAGQSNAEGVDGISPAFVDNDRVNCLSTLNNPDSGGTSYISLSPFSQLQINSRIAPRGRNAWCWGRLGELLVNRLNVPVMFFNVALNGTTSTAWAQTANGNFTANPYLGGIYAGKLPYQNMSDVLKYFVPELGIRAVLWCQGESDNANNTSAFNRAGDEQTYISNIQTVINKTRSESGKNNLSWVISLTSYNNGVIDPKIIRAQQALVQQTPNVIQGPNTDIIQPIGRQDNVHISSELPQLANAWSNSLTDAFFQNSTPYIPVEMTDLGFACGDNKVDVTLPDADKYGLKYVSYQWSNNGLFFDNGIFSTQKQITLNVDGGRQYFARMRDALGNVTQVPAIGFKGSNIPVSNITATGATDFCEGNKAILKANQAAIYEWNNGSKSQEITVTTSGNYSVKTISDFGCATGFSTPLTITSKPVPPKPTITANSVTTFCADSSVTLQSSNSGATTFLWSNGSTNRNIKINTSGNFTVKAISDKGCTSVDSDPLKITVNPLPSTPSIVPNGPTTFCADTNVVLTSSNQGVQSYRWSNGSTSRNITVRNAGDYAVRTVDNNGCVSLLSSATKIKVNALPPVPTISSTRDTVFCQGESTILQSSLVNGGFPTWIAMQDGITSKYNFQNLNVSKSGSFQAIQTDANGCKSGLSASIYIAVKPVPAKIENIVRLSPYTIGIENPKANTYTWQVNGAERTNFIGSTIRFNEAGTFRVTAKNIYKTQSYGDKVCVSELSNEFSFQLYNDGGMSIYPNPSNGLFNIDSKIDWKNSTIEIYNLLGQFIKKGSVNVFDDVKKIDLSDLPEGEYMLRIRTDNFYTITKRILISR